MVTLKHRGLLDVPWELLLALMTAEHTSDHSLDRQRAERPHLPPRNTPQRLPPLECFSLLHLVLFQTLLLLRLLILSLNQLLRH